VFEELRERVVERRSASCSDRPCARRRAFGDLMERCGLKLVVERPER